MNEIYCVDLMGSASINAKYESFNDAKAAFDHLIVVEDARAYLSIFNLETGEDHVLEERRGWEEALAE